MQLQAAKGLSSGSTAAAEGRRGARGVRGAVLAAVLTLSLTAAAAQPGNPLGGTAVSDGEGKTSPCMQATIATRGLPRHGSAVFRSKERVMQHALSHPHVALA